MAFSGWQEGRTYMADQKCYATIWWRWPIVKDEDIKNFICVMKFDIYKKRWIYGAHRNGKHLLDGFCMSEKAAKKKILNHPKIQKHFRFLTKKQLTKLQNLE